MYVTPEEQRRLDELRDMERFWLVVTGISASALVLAVVLLMMRIAA